MDKNPNTIKTFKGKCVYFLGYIYENGGSEYRPNDFSSSGSYPLAGVWTRNDFESIIEALVSKEWITYEDISKDGRGGLNYHGVKLTEAGINKVEQELPQIPLIDLVSQEITTGDLAVDEKINHARKLFFKDGATVDDMRSACEALSFVLEPLRDDLKLAITSADVEAFFQFVNTFDIRHNKAHTKNLIHPEQLEWVFYSLLNTINTYIKLKARLTNL